MFLNFLFLLLLNVHQYKWVFIMFSLIVIWLYFTHDQRRYKRMLLWNVKLLRKLCAHSNTSQVRLSWLYEQRCALFNCTIGKLHTPLPPERRRLSTLGHRHINRAHGSIASAVTSLFEKPEHCSCGSRPHLHSTWTPWCSRTQTALSQKSMPSKSYRFSSEVGGSRSLLKYERCGGKSCNLKNITNRVSVEI